MPTILRQAGFHVMIYTNDHRPPHVHVVKAGTEVVVDLHPIGIRENYRMSKRNVRQAMEIAETHQQQLLLAWRAIHGDE